MEKMVGNAFDRYCRDVMEQAWNLDPVIGRDEEITNVVEILAQKSKNNVLLIGEPGVGKTAIVEGLAQRIISGDVPEYLKKVRVLALDIGNLLAGTGYRGDLERKLTAIIEEMQQAEENVILFIDELHLAIGAGRTEGGNVDMANLLKQFLARDRSWCIGATTLEEYTKYISKDAAFDRRFQKLVIGEPSVPDTINILRGLKKRYEKYHDVRILDGALVAAVELSRRYVTEKYLPDKAIELVDKACTKLRLQIDNQPEEITTCERIKKQLDLEFDALKHENDKASKARFVEVNKKLDKIRAAQKELMVKYKKHKEAIDDMRSQKQKRDEYLAKFKEATINNSDLATITELQNGLLKAEDLLKGMSVHTVGPDQIAEVASRATGIPVSRIGTAEKDKLLGLEIKLNQRVLGQTDAVTAVVDAVIRSRTGVGKANQPIGSFLFLGPTGVGKTELAKALADELFGDEKFLVRLDMSEYMDPGSVTRLIGSSSGYGGHDDRAGQLTEPVRRKPYSVVLLDEIEKADKSVFNILLQLLDDGRLTTSQGRTVDFANTVIILTSNLGAEYLLEGISGASTKDEAHLKVMKEVRGHFKPELVSRVDEILIFDPLSHDHLRQITRLLIRDVVIRLSGRGIALEVTEAAVDLILAKSYNQVDGARSIGRWIEKAVVTKLGKTILNKKIDEGSSVLIHVKPNENDLCFIFHRNRESEIVKK